MRRPSLRPTSVTVRKRGDQGVVTVRAGDKELGTVERLGGENGEEMSGDFTNRPAFADFVGLFSELSTALGRGADGAAEAERLAAEIEAQEIVVWHSLHDMRIDRALSLTISGGKVRFRPSDAFHMMRTGGLG